MSGPDIASQLTKISTENTAQILSVARIERLTVDKCAVDSIRYWIILEQAAAHFDRAVLSNFSQMLREIDARGAYQDCALASYRLTLGVPFESNLLINDSDQGLRPTFDGMGNHTLALFKIDSYWLAIDSTARYYIDLSRQEMDYLVLVASDVQSINDLVTKIYGSSWHLGNEAELLEIEQAFANRWKFRP